MDDGVSGQLAPAPAAMPSNVPPANVPMTNATLRYCLPPKSSATIDATGDGRV